MTTDVARRKALGLVGLGLRGRLAVVGVQQVRDSAKRGKLKVALVANDASPNSLDKIAPLLAARNVPVIDVFSSAELGELTGREAVAVIGVTDSGLAKGIAAAVPVVVAVAGQAKRTARHSSRRDSRR
ncbi:MAG: ribosomal L7Ae/L30e/S12e/Gadd45 family protein [Gemmatimonadaceae bacterium]